MYRDFSVRVSRGETQHRGGGILQLAPDWGGSWGTSSGSYDETLDRAAAGVAGVQASGDESGSGCAVASGAGAAPAAAWLLALLGLAATLRRRR